MLKMLSRHLLIKYIEYKNKYLAYQNIRKALQKLRENCVDEAENLLKNACSLGSRDAYEVLGFHFESRNNFLAAIEYYHMAIKLGYFEVQFKLTKLLKKLSPKELEEIGDKLVAKNPKLARKCYSQACQQGDPQSFWKYFYIKIREYPVDIIVALGNDYLENNKYDGCLLFKFIEKYHLAKLLYEIALNKDANYSETYRKLGNLYENGLGVTKDMVTAVKLYQQAIDRGDNEAETLINIILNQDSLTTNELLIIGNLYLVGEDVNLNYVKVHLFYQAALDKDINHGITYRKLGYLYENGLGVTKDIKLAAKYYQQAIERHDMGAKQVMENLFNSISIVVDNQTREQLNSIGDMFFKGEEVNIDIQLARKWYEGPRGSNIIYARKKLKEMEKQIIIEGGNTPVFNINGTDNSDNTALHRAAKYLHLTNFARLAFLGASDEKENNERKKPFSYLVEKNNVEKFERCKNRFTYLINHLKKSPIDVLFNRLYTSDGSPINKSSLKAIESLYKIEDIKSIIDLAKLAALGLHDLSDPYRNDAAKKRRIFRDDYDSDDDYDDSISDEQKLNIVIDPMSNTIEKIYHYGESGQDGKNAVGIYTHKNVIYFGGDRAGAEKRGTLIHELVHFTCLEVFKNKCNPYDASDLTNKAKFENICSILKQKYDNNPENLHPIFQAVFSKTNEQPNYQPSKYHSELIARIPQLLVVDKKRGKKILEDQAANLLDYYHNIFLVNIKNHILKIENRVLRGWPKELFFQNNRAFALESITSNFDSKLDTSSKTPLKKKRKF